MADVTYDPCFSEKTWHSGIGFPGELNVQFSLCKSNPDVREDRFKELQWHRLIPFGSNVRQQQFMGRTEMYSGSWLYITLCFLSWGGSLECIATPDPKQLACPIMWYKAVTVTSLEKWVRRRYCSFGSETQKFYWHPLPAKMFLSQTEVRYMDEGEDREHSKAFILIWSIKSIKSAIWLQNCPAGNV